MCLAEPRTAYLLSCSMGLTNQSETVPDCDRNTRKAAFTQTRPEMATVLAEVRRSRQSPARTPQHHNLIKSLRQKVQGRAA